MDRFPNNYSVVIVNAYENRRQNRGKQTHALAYPQRKAFAVDDDDDDDDDCHIRLYISDVSDKMLPPSSDKTIYPRQNDVVERKQLDLSDAIVIGNPSRLRPQDVFTTSVFRFTDNIIMYTSYTNTRTRAIPLHMLNSTHGACTHLCEFENIVEPIWV